MPAETPQATFTDFPGAWVLPPPAMGPWRRVLIALLSIFAMLFVVRSDPVTGVGILVANAVLGCFLAWQRARWPAQQGRISADVEGLRVDDQLVIPARDIVRVLVAAARGTEANTLGPEVVVHHRVLHAVRVAVPDLATAQALRAALGHDVLHRAVHLQVDSFSASRLSRVALALLALLASLGSVLVAMASCALGTEWSLIGILVGPGVLLALALPRRVTIGRDGLLLRWGWRRQWVPLSSVRSVRRVGSGLSIERVDAGPLEMDATLAVDPVAEELTSRRGRAVWMDNLMDQLEMALRARDEAPEAPRESDALRAGDRDVAAWRAELLALGAPRVEHYRAGALRVDDLWRTVEAHDTDAELRVAAAVALGPSLDAAGRVRIEQLATRTAEPALKQALEATATDDTDAQLRALTRAARRR